MIIAIRLHRNSHIKMKTPFFAILYSIKLLTLLFLVQACVPARQFEDTKAAKERCETALAEANKDRDLLRAQNKDMSTDQSEVGRELKKLKDDTSSMGSMYRRLNDSYEKLMKVNDQLLDKNRQLLAGKDDENTKLMGQYQMTQAELQRKEDKLRESEEVLNRKREELDALSKNLEQSQEALTTKQKRVAELEALIEQQDKKVKQLQEKMSNALLGFKDKGLTVSLKDGKVYVSMEESLLFASGRTDVDPKGQEALKDIAKLLEKETDINITVEGHTDNVPIKGGAIKDNWDLSVLRATSIVKILLSNGKIEPIRLTPAGKGEYLPLDKGNTPEARKKNRRTEIILTPQLDVLYNLLNDK